MPALKNDREERFANQYLQDLNATAAAIRAGFPARTASSAGSRTKGYPRVAARIAELQAERSVRTAISADRVLRELARIAFADARDAVLWGPDGVIVRPSDSLDDDTVAAIREISSTTTPGRGGPTTTVAVKLHDKLRALAMLAEHTGIHRQAAEDPEKLIGTDNDPEIREPTYSEGDAKG